MDEIWLREKAAFPRQIGQRVNVLCDGESGVKHAPQCMGLRHGTVLFVLVTEPEGVLAGLSHLPVLPTPSLGIDFHMSQKFSYSLAVLP